MFKFKIYFVFLLMFGSVPDVSARTLSMFLWSKDLAPIISFNTGTYKYEGIVLDIFASLPKDHQVKIKVKSHNRTRGEIALYSGEIDFTILPKEWLKNPEKLIFSLPIYVLNDFLYATKAIPDISFVKLLKNQVVCTRRNYVYPKLTSLFSNRLSFRMDSNEASSQFGMLLRDRCDFVVINDFVGEQAIEDNNWQSRFIKSNLPLDSVKFTFAFHPSLAEFVVHLNQHIVELKSSGELQEIVKRHRNMY